MSKGIVELNDKAECLKDAENAYLYARYTLKGKRFEEAEDLIAGNPYYAYCYAKDILRGKFEKGEEAIKKDKTFWQDYCGFLKRKAKGEV